MKLEQLFEQNLGIFCFSCFTEKIIGAAAADDMMFPSFLDLSLSELFIALVN